jgi:DNA-binding SARP family transcriptional activator/tetratricopeptide (TPR) repeat protein
VQLRVLGPVELRVDGVVVDVGPPRQQAILAVLAVDAGRAVPVAALTDRVWGDDAQPVTRSGLYAYLSRLRQAFATAGLGETIKLVSQRGGYLLEVDPDQVDICRFRRLVRAARTAQDNAGLLDEAVALWRGPALSGLSGGWAERTRQLLEQERLDAMLLWAAAQLRCGRAGTVAGALRELVDQHPLVEPLAARLIEALGRDGRTAEALDCYTATRRRLVEELGAEPGPELRRVHQAVLAGELPPASAQRPAQLRADVPGFVGRAAELATLDAIAQRPAIVISGTAGVGKTTLAVHWAHRVADRFPDGQLYVDLRGFDPDGKALDAGEAVRRFLDATGAQRIPADPDAQVALYRSQLAGKRMLIVVDNARDTAQVRPLLPGSPGCLVVVTSRNQLTGLVTADGAYPITLDLLTEDEARELLVSRLGPGPVAKEPEAVREIVTRCARLPLAVAVAAARAATRPRLPLAALAAELSDSRRRLQALASADDPHTDVQAVLSWSYQELDDATARLFRLLGLHPGPDITAPAAASLAAATLDQVRDQLDELTRANLLSEHTPGRYACHDLLRSYATEQTRRVDTEAERAAATTRMLDHYLHTAYAADRLLDPVRDPIELAPPEPGVRPEAFDDDRHAEAWFGAERQVLLGAIDQDTDTHTWQLAWALHDFLYRRGYWQDRVTTGRAAIAAAHRLADPTAEARARRLLAAAHAELGRFDDADTQLRYALELYQHLGDPVEQAQIRHILAYVRSEQGRPGEALEQARQALELYAAGGHQAGQANALNAVGWYHAHLGEYREAIAYCRRGLRLSEQLADRAGQAATWDSLGYAQHHLGDYAEALASYQQALDLHRELGTRHYQADTLSHLGDTYEAVGDHGAAGEAWQQALDILTELDHPDAARVRGKLTPG